MQGVGSSVFTAGYSPISQRAGADARAERRSDELQQRNSLVSDEQKRKDLQASGEVVSATARDQEFGYRKVSASGAANKQYALYAEEERRLPNSQQRALQAYSETQNISRIDADIDYLGSIDIFV